VVFKLHGMRSTDIDDYLAARSISVIARGITVQEVIRLLKMYDVEAEEVQRIVKVDRFRVKVVLRFEVRGKTFTMSYFGKQNFCVRVHWLPVIMNNDVLHEVFSTFGKVVKGDLEILRTVYRGCAWRCRLHKKLEIPHMLEFADGLKALVTMSGRAPLCLRCGEVGHVRQTCPPLRLAPGAVTVRGTEAPDRRPADALVPARQTATPVKATPAATATAVVKPAEVTEEADVPAKDAAVSDASGQDVEDGNDMDWLEERGHRRSRCRSSEGRGPRQEGLWFGGRNCSSLENVGI